jgi:hypothetical protein
LLVACSDQSGLPVTIRSSPAQTIGPTAISAGRAAARALDLERGGPDDRGEVGDVDVAADREEREVEARQQQEDRDGGDDRCEGDARQTVEARGENHERGDRAEHLDPKRGAAEHREHGAEGDRERVLGRCVVGRERGRMQVQDLAAPEQVVLGVVDRVCREDEEADQRRQAEHGEGELRPRRRRDGAQPREQRGLHPAGCRTFHCGRAYGGREREVGVVAARSGHGLAERSGCGGRGRASNERPCPTGIGP